MQQQSFFYLFPLCLCLLLLSACSNTRFLTEDQKLYTGISKIEITDKEKLKKDKATKEVIHSITFSKPNNALFGTRRILLPIGLWTHNYLKRKKEGKTEGWVYRNFHKDPILISTVNPELRCRKLETALF